MPYTGEAEISKTARKLPQYLQGKGFEVRTLMPRFGNINERRHRLHEVVRLSGMNIIVDDDDYPLIIKVASLPEARIQVYFLDNEEFFKRKHVFQDENGQLFEDNPDRMVFFCKSIIETVKKFGWAPDIIHCHGWMTSLIPVYLKEVYKSEPIFEHSKVVYSVYQEPLSENFSEKFLEKASINQLSPEDLKDFTEKDAIKLHKGAIKYADAVILGSESASEVVKKELEETERPVLEYQQDENYLDTYLEFYNSLLPEEVEE